LHQNCEELGIPVTTFNTITLNRNKIIEQSLSVQQDANKIKTAKYEKVQVLLMEWFQQKRALNS
jgi:hypothetical protein